MQPHTPSVKEYFLEASSFQWEIAPGRSIPVWGFNEQLPGPMLKAMKGDIVSVHVKNNLIEPTMIHWHGIRLQASMDGTGEVQQPIAPGETFTYRFEVPDAGTFWYHSHANETVQMERGMYGSLIVEDETDPVFDNERVMMLDDMKLNKKNEFVSGNKLSRWIERHDGRQGEILLLNGKENREIQLHAGQTERWRFINAASARYVMLQLGGKPFQIIGTDGGLIERPYSVTEVLLTPGERIDIMAGPYNEGESFAIETLPYNRMTFVKSKFRQFAMVKVGAPRPSVVSLPQVLRSIPLIAGSNAAVTRKVKLSVGPSLQRGIDFLVNNELHMKDAPVIAGELQIWEVANTSMMDHPFHLHGFFFQVLEINGEPAPYRSWKDTVNLTPRSKVKIAWMPDNRPGKWMYHCHILEHHAAGMMGHFEVVDSNSIMPAASKQVNHCHN